jgi:hypothetical protein
VLAPVVVVSYPTVLLPQPTYLLLTPADMPAGWLIRWVKGATVFTSDIAKSNGRPLINVSQLGSPAQRLPEGLSVNLLGNFELAHAGWQHATDAAREFLRLPWPVGTSVALPAPADMQYLPREEWDVYALNIAEVEACELETGRGKFRPHVCHAPNGWNYWHYEVRFEHETLGWVHAPDVYSDNQLRKVGEVIRQAFQEAGLAQPQSAVGVPPPWPQALFDTATPTQP